jgi:molybdenum cofactor guanylyltransferase
MTQPSITAAILSGGTNRRMGRDKALLPLGEKPLVLHVADRAREITEDVQMVAPVLKDYKHLGIPCELDQRSGVGPIAGLETALLGLRKDLLLLMACDMPFVSPAVLRVLLENWEPKYQAVVFRIDGTLVPMPGLYRRDVLYAVERMLARREYELARLLSEIKVKEVPEEKLNRIDPDLKSFVNLNTIEAYRRYALEAAGKPPLSF